MNNPYPEKRKNRSPLAVIVNGWGCALGAVMLGVGLVFGLVLSLFVAPQLLGFHVTATALAEYEILLAATGADLELREDQVQSSATLLARDVLATQAALNNQADWLASTAAQAAFNQAATSTAEAAASVRQQTQIALNFAATQAQFQQNATQIELDYRNTQAALGITPSGSDASSANLAATVTPSPTQTASPTLTQTPPPTRTALPTRTPTPFALESDFSRGFVSGWNAPSDQWNPLDGGIRSLVNGGLLLSERDFSGDVMFSVTFDPAQVASSQYDLLFGVGESGGYTFHIDAQGVAASDVTFYQFSGAVAEADTFTNPNLAVIVGTRSGQLLRAPSTLRLEVRGLFANVYLDNTLLLGTDLQAAPSGFIGVRLPAGAVLRQLTVRELR